MLRVGGRGTGRTGQGTEQTSYQALRVDGRGDDAEGWTERGRELRLGGMEPMPRWHGAMPRCVRRVYCRHVHQLEALDISFTYRSDLVQSNLPPPLLVPQFEALGVSRSVPLAISRQNELLMSMLFFIVSHVFSTITVILMWQKSSTATTGAAC